jgi:hypothetical protein
MIYLTNSLSHLSNTIILMIMPHPIPCTFRQRPSERQWPSNKPRKDKADSRQWYQSIQPREESTLFITNHRRRLHQAKINNRDVLATILEEE